MTALADTVRHAIAEAFAACPHGTRTAAAQRLATLYGVSLATVYRIARRNGARRPRAPRHPEYREWVRTAVQLVHRAPKPIPLEAAIEAGVAGGALPPEAAAMPLGTAHRLARELGLVARPKRTQRLDADYPMQAIQIDGSSSEHWVVDRILPDGDYVLKLHRAPYPASGYKNKPLGPERLRVLVYAVWDLCTGYTQSRYCVALGENAFDALDFLCWALSGKADPRVPFHGRPEHLWSDQGALFKSAAAHDLLERLDIELVTGAPYAKTRMGGVERSHRTRWQCFERPLFLRAQDTLTLSALNTRLAAFEIAENARRPARARVGGRTVSRADAWVALTNTRPADNRLRKVPADALETLALEARRFVDANGIVRWDGHHYTCERLHSSWVIARRPADGTDTVVVEDETTGARHIATPVTRRAELDDWLKDHLGPLLDTLDPTRRHVFGMDFARSGDLSVIAPLELGATLNRRCPFLLELQNVPHLQQVQALTCLGDRLPRLSGGAIDAGGNGSFIAEAAVDHYGSIIDPVKFTEAWYREHMPRYKAAFEDGTIAIPKHDDVLEDHRAIQLVRGVPKLPPGKTDRKGERHGDAAIALALAYTAAHQARGPIEFQSAGHTTAARLLAGYAEERLDLTGYH